MMNEERNQAVTPAEEMRQCRGDCPAPAPLKGEMLPAGDREVLRARALLETMTPLREDCGHLCGGACCRSQPGEETGMLLFPGEECLYEGLPGYRLVPTAQGTLLLCSGHCRREERPLACRLFPLLPVVRDGTIRVTMDARAAAVCPLYRMGRGGLCAEFTEAVRACGQLLLRDETQAAFLVQLTRAHDELKQLQKQFGG